MIYKFLGAFAMGMSPIPWALNSEIYPDHLKGMGNGFSTFANWSSNYVGINYYIFNSVSE